MKQILSRQIVGALAGLFLFSNIASSQQKFFSPAPEIKSKLAATVKLKKHSIFKLDEKALRQYLKAAPLENSGIGSKPIALNIPFADGSSEIFYLYESPILAPSVASMYPDVKTYSGKAALRAGWTIRLSFTTGGFNAIILDANGGSYYIEKLHANKESNAYLIYSGADAADPSLLKGYKADQRCGSISNSALQNQQNSSFSRAARTTSGGTLRTFKLAISANGEFTIAKGGGTKTGGYNAVIEHVNRLNAVFQKELSVRFSLVSTTATVFTDSTTDPFPFDDGAMLDPNQTTLDNAVGDANYDIGHVLGYSEGITSGGGIAQTSSACVSGSKAKGVSKVNSGEGVFPLVFGDQVFAHEIGHQVAMSHSFNSSIPVCTTREPSTSVEIGSGTTIMSYGYTCSSSTGNDDYELGSYMPFLNFHAVNYSQAIDFINTLSCFASSVTGNSVPTVVSFTNNRTIPKSTPFMLTGLSADVNTSDVLSYSWEGTNVGTMTPVDATFLDETQPPFFRSYPPSATPSRYYPRLSAILDGSNKARGDKLPSVGIVTTHSFTVRDNVDGVATAAATITVDGTSGPFLVTSNLAGSYASFSSQNITWSVNNTNNALVNCSAVDILLSVNGGQTFPYVLAATTANDGTENVTFPNIPQNTSTARIKVQASNNIFFDISNSDFSIAAGPLPLHFLNFTASLRGKEVFLNWKVSSEKNIKSYVVEKAVVSTANFTGIGWEVALNNGLNETQYQRLDTNPKAGANYYRIKALGKDGSVEYSTIASVKIGKSNSGFTIYPNPANAQSGISIQINGAVTDVYQLKLINSKGQIVYKKSVRTTGNSYSERLSLPVLTAGIYFAELTNSDGIQQRSKLLIK